MPLRWSSVKGTPCSDLTLVKQQYRGEQDVVDCDHKPREGRRAGQLVTPSASRHHYFGAITTTSSPHAVTKQQTITKQRGEEEVVMSRCHGVQPVYNMSNTRQQPPCDARDLDMSHMQRFTHQVRCFPDFTSPRTCPGFFLLHCDNRDRVHRTQQYCIEPFSVFNTVAPIC